MRTNMNDPVADLLTRLRNSLQVGAEQMVVPHSKLREQLLKLLKDYGFIAGYTVKSEPPFKQVEVRLTEAKRPLTGLKRISKPGRRIYSQAADLKTVRGGHGLLVVSTPQGLMAGHTAKVRQLGGEVICEVW